MQLRASWTAVVLQLLGRRFRPALLSPGPAPYQSLYKFAQQKWLRQAITRRFWPRCLRILQVSRFSRKSVDHYRLTL